MFTWSRIHGQLDPSVVVPDTDSSAMEKDLYDLEILRQPKQGPLDIYRKKASFDWRKMRIFMDGEDILRFKVNFYVDSICNNMHTGQLAWGPNLTILNLWIDWIR